MFSFSRVLILQVVPFRAIESQGGQSAMACKITDHDLVLRCLKTLSGVELQDIPHMTLSVVKKFQECVGNQWKPLWDGWCSDEQVDELLGKLPKTLRDALLPFQLEGVRFGLRRGGRCLIADEMGLGKTIQVTFYDIDIICNISIIVILIFSCSLYMSHHCSYNTW